MNSVEYMIGRVLDIYMINFDIAIRYEGGRLRLTLLDLAAYRSYDRAYCTEHPTALDARGLMAPKYGWRLLIADLNKTILRCYEHHGVHLGSTKLAFMKDMATVPSFYMSISGGGMMWWQRTNQFSDINTPSRRSRDMPVIVSDRHMMFNTDVLLGRIESI